MKKNIDLFCVYVSFNRMSNRSLFSLSVDKIHQIYVNVCLMSVCNVLYDTRNSSCFHCLCYLFLHADWNMENCRNILWVIKNLYTIMNFIVIHRSRSTFLNCVFFFLSRGYVSGGDDDFSIAHIHELMNMEIEHFLPNVYDWHNFQTRNDDWDLHFTITISCLNNRLTLNNAL